MNSMVHSMPAPAGATKDDARVALSPAIRKQLAVAIDSLIALLDQIDGDENLEEPGDVEPNLGWTDRHTGFGDTDEREIDDADAEDDGHDEPSLGSSETCIGRDAGDQTQWGAGNRQDREMECEDEGGQCDDEGVPDEDAWFLLIPGGNELVAS